MERCSVKPYKGFENYIFISYCQEDKKEVFPIIEWMSEAGYRVWYDERIDQSVEWVEKVAQRINESFAFVAFISESAVDSHNCRQEINFAIRKKKHFVSVALEKIDRMSLGMEMLLSAQPAICKYTSSTNEDLYECLEEFDFIQACRGEKDGKIPLTVLGNYYLVRTKMDEVIEFQSNEINIGRSETMCQYVIRNNSTVGRCHAKVLYDGQSCKIVDNGSVNGTYLNGNRLEPGKEYVLHNSDQILLSNEAFSVHMR